MVTVAASRCCGPLPTPAPRNGSANSCSRPTPTTRTTLRKQLRNPSEPDVAKRRRPAFAQGKYGTGTEEDHGAATSVDRCRIEEAFVRPGVGKPDPHRHRGRRT